MPKLNEEQIRQRLQEGRNYKHLYHELKDKYDEVKTENKELRQENQELKTAVNTLKIQVAELQTMVFGKKKKPPTGHFVSELPKSEPKPRNKASYRRLSPPAHAITSEELMPLPKNCTCGGSFRKVTVHERYEEDIPLPELTEDYQPHLVTKYVIERGVCGSCGKATAGQALGGQSVTLGLNVRLLICHLVTVVGLSYAQIIQLCRGLYGITVSDGEIANALHAKHQAWQPAYEQLKANVRASPVRHYDETQWKIVAADNSGHAWVMAAANSPSTVFHLATSRGGKHAQKLHGNAEGIHITDDYSPYRNLPGQQQLCWAHLYRCIRDLRHNDNLPKAQARYVTQWYEAFAEIYQDLRTYLAEPYTLVKRQTQSDTLWQCIQTLADQPAPKAGEPNKLTRLKAQLLRAGQDKLLVCLTANTFCDNNRAERDLRPLVLKRKRSFGSKTERGAKALSTVLSICTTTWKANPANYFQALAELG
jgi:transposase